MILRKWLISRIYATWGFLMGTNTIDFGQGNDWQGNRKDSKPGLLSALNVCDGFYANMCPRKCGLFHEVTRSFTKVRADQGRGYAMFGFPSPPQVRCPKWVVRLRETWSHCYGWDQFLATDAHRFARIQKRH